MKTFVKVMEPKTDLWLVRTVRIALIVAQVKAEINTPVIILAIGSALGLAMVGDQSLLVEIGIHSLQTLKREDGSHRTAAARDTQSRSTS